MSGTDTLRSRARAVAERLSGQPDETIDYSEIPALDDDFFSMAELLMPAPGKTEVTMRLDSDVVDFFRREGRGYQTRMNAVLRAYMLAGERRSKRRRS
jgi:uncharacterized protein (DUF4415 family)